MKPLLSVSQGFFFSPQENRKIWIICKCIIIGGLCQASSISMTIAGYDFFSCFVLLVLHGLWNYFSLTASFPACSLWPAVLWLLSSTANSMKKPSSRCLSPLDHRIINAWHISGPDLQSAPTPWMLDASAPIGGSQLLLACFACLVLSARLVLVSVWWWSSSPDALVIYVYVYLASRSRGSSALWIMCETVVILLSAQDYHSSYRAVLFPLPPRGSNLTGIQHTDWV